MTAATTSIPRSIVDSISGAVTDGDALLERENRNWHDYLKTYRIFCVSEDRDNLLMWAHYADNHAGVVLEFRCVPEVDSPFCVAIPVTYQHEKPTLGSFDEVFRDLVGFEDVDFVRKNEDMIYVKSDHWAYEKEWRYPLPTHNPSELFDLRAFHPLELSSVVLGCRMTEENKAKVVRIVNDRYPHCGVYQAETNDRKYTLDINPSVS